VTVTGTGTAADPYVLTATAGDGSETILNDSPTVTVTGSGTTADPYVLTATAGDGSETILNDSPTVTVTGSGTTADPYILTATAADGSETILNGSATVTVTGTGTTADPYISSIPDGAVTTPKILDDSVTPDKIAQGADGQVLITNGTDVDWDHLSDPALTGSILFSDGNGGIAENNDQLFWDTINNRMGIGTITPDSKLQVNGLIRASGFRGTSSDAPGNPTYRFFDDANSGMYNPGNSILAFSTDSMEALRINASQNVGIGPNFDTNPILARLHVDGDIRGDDIYSNGVQIPVPDYVFQKYFLGSSELNDSYRFESLKEIEEFIKANHHLPGITSAATAKKEGVWNLSKSNLQNLEKIEELFLHTIAQEKKLESLQAENEALSQKMKALEAQMQALMDQLNPKQ
jgi:hypothetical protein